MTAPVPPARPSAADGLTGGITYDRGFFENQDSSSHESARVVLAELFERYRPGSVVDVGCGVGTWLRAARDLGVVDYLGIDGPYVSADQLWIPPERFLGHDLTTPLDLGRRFDLAICLEVGEHLPPESAVTLVDTLAALAPVLLFSAAVPQQGGDGHVNEQWPRYWFELLAARGFAAHDVLRPRVWADERVAWWYRQNVLLYADESVVIAGAGPAGEPLALVHPGMVDAILTRPATAPEAAPPAVPPGATDAAGPAADRRWWRRGGRAARIK